MQVKAIIVVLLGAAALFAAYVGCWLYIHLRFPALHIPETATKNERLAQIDRWLRDLHERHKFNGGVLVAREGKPLLMQTYGFTDHTAEHELTTAHSFRLASASKQFTAAAILVLVQQDHLSLDDLVTKHLCGFPFDDVTIRHLLNQTSGIPDAYMGLAKQHRDDFGEVLRISDVVTLIQRYPPERLSQSGEKFEYSNTNFVLLAAVVEQVSNQSFEQFMREELFEPLGMKNSRVWNRLSTTPFPHKASDFDQIGEMRTEVTPTWIDGIAGDGAVFCSLEDLLIWDAFWRGNPLIGDGLIADASKPARLNDGSYSDYGFGWVVEKDRVWHNGAWLGARTYIIRYPDRKGCLVVLDNSSNFRIDAITSQLESGIAPLLSEENQ